jgi:transketolase
LFHRNLLKEFIKIYFYNPREFNAISFLRETGSETLMDEIALKIRLHTLKMIDLAKASHIASCFSVIDLLAVLYFSILRIDLLNPKAMKRDRCVFSKGHAAAAVYATLAERGFFPLERLKTFCGKNSELLGHLSHEIPGVECSTGSLGHGLSIGCGMALAEKREEIGYRTFVVISDGELNEGSIWEAILFAAHHRLHRLTLIIDYNKIQSFGNTADIINLEPLSKKFEAFNWDVVEIDGHDYQQIEKALSMEEGIKPKVVIAHTIKGKGVSFMENQLKWHYTNPDCMQYMQAEKELCELHS